MYQEGEIIQLLIGLGMLPLLGLIRIPRGRPGFLYLYWAVGAILVSWVLTVLEGVVLPELLNLLEHFFHAAAGALFLAACWTWAREGTAEDAPSR